MRGPDDQPLKTRNFTKKGTRGQIVFLNINEFEFFRVISCFSWLNSSLVCSFPRSASARWTDRGSGLARLSAKTAFPREAWERVPAARAEAPRTQNRVVH